MNDTTDTTEPTDSTDTSERTETPDTSDPTRRSGESPLEWFTRIAPDEWEATESGYGLVLRSDSGSGDRRIVVNPLDDHATFDERIETDDFGEQWRERERIDGQWYLQTTAGLLLWGIGDSTATDTDESERAAIETRR